ncbi:hypothetical protein [Desulfotruncus alcoholivorax]|uniref:hypothetical protein n=1 Tax=Desulfotruncus alcoholivorax TaxID=265477 RepID=UPI000406C061|nr:hypothetical protein [Desulfotruncus alcoholivorax]
MARVLKKDMSIQHGRNVRLYMYPEQVHWLEQAARLSGYSKSEIVRMALDEYRKKVSLPGTNEGGDYDAGQGAFEKSII